MSNGDFEDDALPYYVELVKMQRHVIAEGMRLLIIVEGRDAAGKDGALRALTRHFSPREFRIFAPSKPTAIQAGSWYFQRFVPHLPAAGEIVCFNRSWYNRAGVEPVMGYCNRPEMEAFLRDVPTFEKLLVSDGIVLLKFYFDISRKEQAQRLADRRSDPLKQWKISPVDARAQELWRQYSRARDRMLLRSHQPAAPWRIVQADRKKRARIALMREVLSSVDYLGRDAKLAKPQRSIVKIFSPARLKDGSLAP
jgi:polyphosphate kinase 2